MSLKNNRKKRIIPGALIIGLLGLLWIIFGSGLFG
jgi:hypothetical protein